MSASGAASRPSTPRVSDRTISLVLGGARSGKSAFAQQLASDSGKRVLFVATGVATDAEMEARIAAHRAARPAAWRCVEAPAGVRKAIGSESADHGVVLVDCLSFLVSNVLIAADGTAGVDEAPMWALVAREIDELLAVVAKQRADLIVVSNEVGMSLVPDNQLGRLYRDVLGRANQKLAAEADAVYLMVAGLPLTVKQPGAR